MNTSPYCPKCGRDIAKIARNVWICTNTTCPRNRINARAIRRALETRALAPAGRPFHRGGRAV